ncbi:MAG: tetratricopeptide repeat protein, partial [Bacteroidota bacterium]
SGLYSTAQSQFEAGKYTEALVTFDQIVKSGGKRTGTIMIYQGMAQMETGQFTTADVTFNTLINSNSIDAQKGYWYKALLFLKQGESDKAAKVLQKISQQKMYKAEEAEELLEQL